MKEVDYKEISWNEFLSTCTALARQLKGATVWGIPRGGAIVAAVMSYHGCYLRAGSQPMPGDVIVDDAVETGKSFKPYPQFLKAALYVRARTIPNPEVIVNNYVVHVFHSRYILLPWEDESEVSKYYENKI